MPMKLSLLRSEYLNSHYFRFLFLPPIPPLLFWLYKDMHFYFPHCQAIKNLSSKNSFSYIRVYDLSYCIGSILSISVCMLRGFSRVQLYGLWPARFHYPWGFSRQEYWSGFPCPPPGKLPHPGIKLTSVMSSALAAGSLPLAPPGKSPGKNA